MDIYLIDGNSYVYRAFYAIRGLRDSRGRPTNAIFGFTNMLLKIIRDLNPGGLMIAFDTPHATDRHRLFGQYKAHRPGAPEEMIEQLPYIRKIIEAFRVRLYEEPGYEADDVIATIAEKVSRAGHRVYIVTADKDMLQLVGDGILVYDPMKNAVLGRDYVLERFGVPPERIPEYMAIVGDAVDNIPGVKGIGEKTAKELFGQFGGLDELMAHPEKIARERTRRLIEEGVKDIKLSYELALINRSAPVRVDIKDLAIKEPDWHALLAMFKEFEFTSLMKYVPGEIPPEGHYETACSEEKLRAIIDGLRNGFSIRIEPGDRPPVNGDIAGIALSASEGRGAYIPLGHDYPGAPVQMEAGAALSILKPILENGEIPKTGHNIKHEALLLREKGIGLGGTLYDTMIASHLINPLRSEHSLETVALEYLSVKKKTYAEIRGKAKRFEEIPVERARGFACHEAELSLELKDILFRRLEEEGLGNCYFNIEMPLIGVLADMERAGVKIDTDQLGAFSTELERELDALRKRIYFHAGGEFNINSPKQLGHILFNVLGLPPGRKKKTGYSTEVGILEELAKVHELPREVLDWRALFKLKSTYVDVLPGLVNPRTGRIHTSFNQAVTATGRLSSTDPNIQNIPVRGDWGRKIREAFIAEEGFMIISADYSQIELRVLAHLSGDEALKRLFQKGKDIHAATASGIFGVAPENITPGMRRVAKGVNFGIIYGITPYGLSENIGVSTSEAAQYINRYFERHPGVKAYLQGAIEEAKRKGYVRTVSGRKRPIPELKSRDARVRSLGERLAMNSPIQGTAADIIKKAMITLSGKLREKYRTRLIIQVHDELVFECPGEELDEMTDIIKSDMIEAAGLQVPVQVDVGTGRNWAQAH
ncbi:MAG: DNA polymerase I [Nitrospiraceae bacterium]|nr:DNA polymerase I [Nitrospiraceae bacterium]